MTKQMHDVIIDRKNNPIEGSYTNYLFEQGLDKILKKVAEESGETIIAAKNGDRDALIGEICDLLYHLQVMMVECGISYEDIMQEENRRSQKISNLKNIKQVDHNT